MIRKIDEQLDSTILNERWQVMSHKLPDLEIG
jgi:hypothetical protein